MARLTGAVMRALPRGRSLPDDVWLGRHRVVTVLVWLHSIGITAFGMIGGFGLWHSLFEGGVIALMAVAASHPALTRNVRMGAGTMGLVTSSAILVHLSGGLIEMHFHFFVMVAIITLYQAWLPFLLAIGFVVLHHGVVGALSPEDVFNHAAALRSPWQWAGLHGFFIMGASAAGLAAWKLNELALDRLADSYQTQLVREQAHREEQDRARETVRQSEIRFRSLVQHSFDVIALVDAEGVVSYISPSIESILGRHPRELFGKVGFDFVHPDDKPLARRNHEFILRQADRACTWELRAQHKNGSWRWLEVTVKNLIHEPAVEGLVAHVRDITERKLAEAEKELLEEQLRQSQKLDAVGQLAGGIAHDFNNLLSVIQNYATFVADDLDDTDPRREDVLEIRNAGDKAASLVHQLLTFSRKEVIHPRRWDLNEILDDIQSMLTRVIPENIELTFDLASPPVWIKVDRSQIDQVLMNLVVNARDAMTAGGHLTIRTRRFPGDENYPQGFVEVVVSDTGTGMSRDVSERVFEPFFTTKERGAGTGLGLSTVYGIVQQAGGEISLTSEPGIGTKFRIVLPSACEADLEATPKRVHRDAPASPGETVLVAEDEHGVGEVIQRILVNHGYQVLVASSGNAALELARSHDGDIHLLLTDVVMPQMSGKELSAELAGVFRAIPTLYMSGYTDDIIAHHGVLDEGENFLEKPFSPESLLSKIRDVLDATTSRPGAIDEVVRP